MKCQKSSNTQDSDDRGVEATCPTNKAICGMELEVEHYQGPGGTTEGNNDAGMTGGKFLCCPLPETNILISQGNAITFNTNTHQAYNCVFTI